MRQARTGQDITIEAAGNLSTLQFTAVVLTTGVNGDASVTGAGANAKALGILQNKPDAAGKGAAVRISGCSKMVVDGFAGAIVPGDTLITDAAGKGVKGVANKDKVVAVAMAPSTAAGDIIEVLVVHDTISA